MIFGINFNGTPIPDGIKRKFAANVRRPLHAPVCPNTGTVDRGNALCRSHKCSNVWFRLVGVGQSAEERDAMLIQANNGRRLLHVVERQTAAGPWYGIYTY